MGIGPDSVMDLAYRVRENDHPEYGGLELEIAGLGMRKRYPDLSRPWACCPVLIFAMLAVDNGNATIAANARPAHLTCWSPAILSFKELRSS